MASLKEYIDATIKAGTKFGRTTSAGAIDYTSSLEYNNWSWGFAAPADGIVTATSFSSHYWWVVNEASGAIAATTFSAYSQCGVTIPVRKGTRVRIFSPSQGTKDAIKFYPLLGQV